MSQLASPVEIYWISGSPFSWEVLLTAEAKGIPYEGKLLQASKGELKTPEFLAINPLGRVSRAPRRRLHAPRIPDQEAPDCASAPASAR